MSIINTMCLSSLCTWETVIRSPVLETKTVPHVGLSLFEIDQNTQPASISVDQHVHSCCEVVYMMQTFHTRCWMFSVW